MRVTKRTKTTLVLPLLTTDEAFMKAVESVPRVELQTPVLKMTVGEFIEALDEGYVAKFLTEKRAYKALGKTRAYKEDVKSVLDFLRKLEIEPSADEKRASNGVLFPSFGERMLVDCVRWFNLHSMSDAERLPLVDYMIMAKAEAASSKYQRNYNKIVSQQ